MAIDPAAVIAATASATGPPVGSTRDADGANHNNHDVKCARNSSARWHNRASQPRTVERATTTILAIPRIDTPSAANSRTRPITSTVNPRRSSSPAGSNTCVT